jgi:nitrite reductase/ring-hydroxylating ferredoxin subunit
MNDRRRFLHVLGASAAAAAIPACGGTDPSSGAGGGGGSTTSATTSTTTTGQGGAGGQGGGAGGAGGQGGQGGQGGSPCDPNPPGVNVGKPSDFEATGLHKVPGTKVLIGRDAGGLYCLTALCPHQFCNMNIDGTVKATGIVCTCHQSAFDNGGAVTKGPANKALKAFALALACDGTLRADMTQVVAATDRLPA